MLTGRYCLPALAALALSGCALLPRPVDPQLVSLADAIRTESDTFYAGLGVKVAPNCAFAANSAAYDHLSQLAAQLGGHLSATHASPALNQAAAALMGPLPMPGPATPPPPPGQTTPTGSAWPLA